MKKVVEKEYNFMAVRFNGPPRLVKVVASSLNSAWLRAMVEVTKGKQQGILITMTLVTLNPGKKEPHLKLV